LGRPERLYDHAHDHVHTTYSYDDVHTTYVEADLPASAEGSGEASRSAKGAKAAGPPVVLSGAAPENPQKYGKKFA